VDDELPWVAQRQRAEWLAKPFMDDEVGSQLKNFYLEDEQAHVARVQTVAWNVVTFRADDELAQLRIDDEIAWAAQYQQQPWSAVVFSDDETLVQQRIVDEEYQYVDRRTTITWTPMVFIVDEDFSMAVSVVIDDIGIEYTARPGLIHYTAASSLLHFTVPVSRIHFTAPDEDLGG